MPYKTPAADRWLRPAFESLSSTHGPPPPRPMPSFDNIDGFINQSRHHGAQHLRHLNIKTAFAPLKNQNLVPLPVGLWATF